ncbi:hypothetical protein H9Q70_009371 [Fusarium xylarioides]|nr:hypothetical protein H9Q70_009371 [Fusarium xylarioides]KAG5776691.1 hypothetical protein H9Q73_009640 [Fusarium xylarioides]KAG5819847.1 hypothetical protein H9Q71_000820 [Fusarium xylarioides]KAG5828894.1 hypothetical protein H9Q74_001036 [Fusarium xylarioides]
MAADAYCTQVNPMVKLLQQLIEERPAGDDPVKNIAKVCCVIIQTGVEHENMKGQRLQDQNYSPMLQEMIRDVDSIMEAYFKNHPSVEGTRGESSSVGHKMRSVEDDAENHEAT